MYSLKETTKSLLILALFLALLPTSAAGVSRDLGRGCWAATEIDPGSVRTVSESRPHGDLFRIDVASPAVLRVEASALSGGAPEPKIRWIGRDCAPLTTEDVEYVDRSLARPVLKVKVAGAYQFRVVTKGHPDGGYRLRVDLSKARPLREVAAKTIDEWEDDDELVLPGSPESAPPPQPGDATKTIDEWEDDDELRADDDGCRPSTADSGRVLLTFERPGVLSIHAFGADLMAFLEPLESSSSGDLTAGAALGPATELLTRVEPGSYVLRWSVSGPPWAACEPRFSFYPL